MNFSYAVLILGLVTVATGKRPIEMHYNCYRVYFITFIHIINNGQIHRAPVLSDTHTQLRQLTAVVERLSNMTADSTVNN